MIKDVKFYREFEDSLIAGSKLSHAQSMAIFAGLWAEGVALGVLRPEDPLEGVETDIRLAQVLNSCSRR